MLTHRTVSVCFFSPLQRNAGRGSRDDHAGQRSAIVRNDNIIDVLRIHLAIRIEQIHQDRFGAAVLNGGEIRANLESHPFDLMTGGAVAGCGFARSRSPWSESDSRNVSTAHELEQTPWQPRAWA